MILELKFTIPGEVERLITLDQSTMKIGALLSNQVVLRAPGVDPIHALIEDVDGKWMLTDLGSASGVEKNGAPIDVETSLAAGDKFKIGGIEIEVLEQKAPVPPPPVAPTAAPPAPPPPPPPGAGDETVSAKTVRSDRGPSAPSSGRRDEERKDVLFSPRKAKPSGDVLEVVAYWGDTVLETELFHPSYRGFEQVTIGDPTKAHLIAAGKEDFETKVLATTKDSGYSIYLRKGMKGRLRRGGKVEKVADKGKFKLGRRDIAHLKYGAVSYFLMFVRPPALNLPKSGPEDPLMMGLFGAMMVLYLAVTSVAISHQPSEKENQKDDIWSIVQVPEKDRPPPVVKKKKPPPQQKPKPPVKIAEVKKPPPKKPPPKPKPKPVKPAKAVAKKKPKQTKPVPNPVKKSTNQTLAQNKNKKPAKKAPSKPAAPSKPKSLNKLSKAGAGMPSTGAKSPNFKLAGPKTGGKLGPSGGPKGGGMNQKGGAIKGKGKASVMGVEGVKNNKASGVNLSKLGVGVGKILNKSGPGAIRTNFKSSAGGAGGGSGSGAKTYGLGGIGSGKSLGLAGGGGANNFGSGSGGFLSGQGGSGGLGGSGLGKAFGPGGGGKGGRGRANVSVPPGDPVVSGGLTPQEISAVIRANLNQIRHCYEQTLQRSPNTSGKISVRFTIAPNGRVGAVNVTNSTISDSKMRGCVTGRIKRWAFPKPRGGKDVTVTYPFVFNPL